MRKGGPKLYAWAVNICDYEACWDIQYFKEEIHARQFAERYKLKKQAPHFEQQVTVRRIEIF